MLMAGLREPSPGWEKIEQVRIRRMPFSFLEKKQQQPVQPLLRCKACNGPVSPVKN